MLGSTTPPIDVAVDDASRVVEYKAARYTVQRPARWVLLSAAAMISCTSPSAPTGHRCTGRSNSGTICSEFSATAPLPAADR